MARQDAKVNCIESNTNGKIKETLDFLLHAYRAKLAVDNPSENCPFNFSEFLENWKDKYEDWKELKEAMTRDLEPLANEGLFDSILPYLTASLNQSSGNRGGQIKKILLAADSQKDFQNIPLISAELKPITRSSGEATSGGSASVLTNTLEEGSGSQFDTSKDALSKKPTTKDQEEADADPEIIIHVCDEGKSLKKDFYCCQSILVKEMGYFTKVTVKGQRLRDMDISVHCDIAVFEWLMRWVKSRNGGYEQSPVLDSVNVIGLMVSADFLLMSNLVAECLHFTAENISHVIHQSPNLGCLNESLTNKIMHFFNNYELETRISHIDKSDRITSRLYTQLVMALNDPEPDHTLGHFASTATLFRCTICSQLLINSIAPKVPCCTVKCDCRGRIYAVHVRDPNWTLTQFIRDLKKELKLWKKVYWRLWSIVHFFSCSHCQQYFCARDFSSCRFHPSPPVASIVVVSKLPPGAKDEKVEELTPGRVTSARRSVQLKKDNDIPQVKTGQETAADTIICPYGTFPCCKQPSYQFQPFPSCTGCEIRDHLVTNYPDDDPAIKLIKAFTDLIVVTQAASEKNVFDWAGLIDISPQKIPSTSSTASVFSQRATASSIYGMNSMANRKMLLNMDSSSTESNSLSDNEDLLPKTDDSILMSQRYSNTSDFWSWNPEYTTRYNQDMQREREEKLMADLEVLMAQRVAIDSAGSAGFSRFSYLGRRTQKSNGGSFIRLEEQWKEEVQQNSSKSVKHANKFSKL